MKKQKITRDVETQTTESPLDKELGDTGPLYCPISCERLCDPVIAADGHTYEKSAIVDWFKICAERKLPCTSPQTRELLKNKTLTPNHAIKQLAAALSRS